MFSSCWLIKMANSSIREEKANKLLGRKQLSQVNSYPLNHHILIQLTELSYSKGVGFKIKTLYMEGEWLVNV